ncbi:MAG: ubiquinol-cytochrome C chaperone [Alphaproteobacteria bacterium]|nr:ubiquinol-cytochrome C chaperone [Alphaproteobacteria bacterium]
MFAWIKQRKSHRRVAENLYRQIVERARTPEFYDDLGIEDSLEGRYEMVVAHLILVIERLRADGEMHRELARSLVERFVTDMDDSMRELGIGDTSVPKKVKQAAAGLVERTARYREALASGPAAIAQAIRSGLADSEDPDAAGSPSDTDHIFAAYMSASAKSLAGLSLEDMLSEKPLFAPLDFKLRSQH